MSSDHVERTRAIPGSVHPEPHPTYAGTDSDVSVELVDIESQGLSDVDGVLIESQTIPTKLTAQNTATPTTAPAKTESTIDDDQFSLTSGLTESMWHLSELETISNSSTRVDVQVVKIADTTLMKRIEENSKWIDDGGKFQECRVRGGDGSAVFHTGDEAMSAERERIIPKGIRRLRNCFALPRHKHVGVLSSG